MSATVVNTGDGGTSRQFHVFFELDGAFIGQSIVNALAKGGSVQVNQTWTATLGDHNIRASADRFDVVPESLEANNDLVTALPSVAAPDLVISAIIPSPQANLVDGQQVAIAATVTNAGSGDLPGSFVVRFEIDGAFLAQQQVTGGLSTGVSVLVTADWTAQVGGHTARAIADSAGAVTETNEANNTSTIPLPQVPASDLTAVDIQFAPSQGVIAGQGVTITTTVVNTSAGATLRAFRVRFEVDDVAIGSRRVTGGLPPGGQVEVSQVWTSESGVHTARVVVDETNAVTESDETNNQLTMVLPKIADSLVVVGQVTLQGRTDHTGVSVTFADTATSDIYQVTTDAGGNFSIDLPSGVYHIEASHRGYLSARRFDVVIGVGQPNTLPPATLAGGDADGDGDVDARDLLIIARHFNTADTSGDHNGDGLVDILDLAMAGSNYGKTESHW